MYPIHPAIHAALELVLAGGLVSGEQAEELAHLPEKETPGLLLAARTLRQAFHGEERHLCAITNARSGRCSENCAFCAQSSHWPTSAPIYPMRSVADIVAQAERAAAWGVRCFSIVTSGLRLTPQERDIVCQVVTTLRQRTDLELAASLGLLSDDDACALRQAGLTRYHHNLETAPSYFPAICSTHDLAQDIATVRTAQAHGLAVCCGGILGLGESWSQRIELALTLRDLGVERIPLNFLTPIPGTPLAHSPLLSPHDALKSIALFRMLLPHAGIVIAGGRGRILGDYQSWIFLAGASGAMVGDYLTTPGRDINADLTLVDLGKWI